jgi:hypothetical protein
MWSNRISRTCFAGKPYSPNKRGDGSRHGLTTTSRTKSGCFAAAYIKTGAAFERRIGRLQILFQDDAENVMGRVDAALHPGVNVLAALDLPF